MTSVPQITQKLVWRETPDGVVIVDPTGGNVRVLNEVASDIWKLLNDNKTTADIEAFLVAEYEVESAQAAADVQHFLNDLAQQGLVTLA